MTPTPSVRVSASKWSSVAYAPPNNGKRVIRWVSRSSGTNATAATTQSPTIAARATIRDRSPRRDRATDVYVSTPTCSATAANTIAAGRTSLNRYRS